VLATHVASAFQPDQARRRKALIPCHYRDAIVGDGNWIAPSRLFLRDLLSPIPLLKGSALGASGFRMV
jgi:hypothetical protein